MVDYVFRDGQRLTPHMKSCVDRLSDDLFNAFGVRIVVTSGIRTAAEQEAIFRERYVVASEVRGRRVYDTRVWRGVTWYRISSAGTVAVPTTSNHEIQGSKAAVDLRDTGSDAGITTSWSVRGRWIRANAAKYDMIASGDGFGEGWHFDVINIFAGGGGGSSSGSSWPANALYGARWVEIIQAKANTLGAGLTVDGQDGPATQTWIKNFQELNGLTADGVAGPATNERLDQILSLVEDGQLGPLTIRRLQYAFGVNADGDWGPATTTGIQRYFGLTQDGQLGPITIKALQRSLGVTADGEIGPNTILAIQKWLNSGRGLVVVPEPETPVVPPKPAATPRVPVYPKAVRGWDVPLASERATGESIDWFIIHHQGATRDDEDYFKSDNSRTSCPTWQVKADGSVVEFIPPNLRPSSTSAANGRSVAVETQNTTGDPEWGISKESHESIAQLVAWMSKQKYIGGVAVNISLDRDHIFGHREVKEKTGLAIPATACPGPSMDLDWIVKRAREIIAPTLPDPEPEVPSVFISKSEIVKHREAAVSLVSFFDSLLETIDD